MTCDARTPMVRILTTAILVALGHPAAFDRARAANPVPAPTVENSLVAVNAFEEFAYKLVRRIAWPGNHVFFTSFSPDGKLYLGGGDTGTLRVWEVKTGTQRIELPIVAGLVTPDGKQVLGHKYETTFILFDLDTGREVRRWDADQSISSMAISADGTRVISGHTDGVLRLWNLENGQELRKFKGHEGPADVAFSADGKRILSSGADKMIRLWNVENAELVKLFDNFKDATPMNGHDLIVKAFLLPDGRSIAGYVWGVDKTLLVLNVADGSVVRTFDLGDDHHKDVAISPDGRWFLTGHGDRTIRLRDLRTGNELQRLEVTDTNVPRALNFSPDNGYIVSGSWRSWVYLWELGK
jgi:WD40 repeat protein